MKTRTIENPKVGDKVTFLKTSKETNGEYILVEVEMVPKGGNPLHYHRTFSETFMPIEGELTIQLGSKKLKLYPGDHKTVPPMAVHNFKNESDKTIKFQVKISPARDWFEYGLRIGYGLAVDGLTDNKGIPSKFSHMAVLFDNCDSNLPGFLSLITPIMKWKAKKARKQGVEQELLQRYCV
jgi:quercetin dioxygenase-like cupin family protein